MKVIYTGYYWSGYEVEGELDSLPKVGDKICVPGNPREYVVSAISQTGTCPHCMRYVIHCNREEDQVRLRDYYKPMKESMNPVHFLPVENDK